MSCYILSGVSCLKCARVMYEKEKTISGENATFQEMKREQ